MVELKTRANKKSVSKFLQAITDKQKKADCFELVKIMEKITGEKAQMWGTSIVGFGKYHYKYETGREADWTLVGFSPRKQNLTIYIMAGFQGYPELMQDLGKYKTGASCLYVKRLANIDKKKLEKLIKESVEYMKEKYK